MKSVAESEKKSVRTIQRYIALTRLIPEFLKMLDEEKLPFTVGVELSYLKVIEQPLYFNSWLKKSNSQWRTGRILA